MPYAILRFQKAKSGGIAGRDRHDERKKSEYKSNPNIDKTKSDLNYHLIEPNGKYKNSCMDRIQEVGCRIRSNSILMVETMITTSPEFMNQLNPPEQRQFFERAAAFLYERIGKENVISAVVHMDEKTPHMHFCFVPITKDGRLSAKEVLGNKAAFCKWQDDFYDRMHGFYPDLQRGLPAAVTGRKHIPSYVFSCADSVGKSFDAINQALQNVNVFNAGKKRDEALRAIGEYLPNCYKLIEQSKSIDSYVSTLEERIAEQKRLTENANQMARDEYAQIRQLQNELFLEQEKAKQLRRECDKAQKIIDRIPPEIKEQITRKSKKKEYER